MNILIENRLFIMVLLICSSFLLLGCYEYTDRTKGNQAEKVIDLSGNWKFSIGDDPEWKDPVYNDSRWEKIHVPSSWENQGFYGYNGYAWYRKSFKFPENQPVVNIYLHIGHIDDVDEVYFNGKMIGLSGGFPPQYQTAYNAYRRYFVPEEFINRNGENVIAVRVYDAEIEGGIISGDIGLFREREGLSPDLNLSGTWKFNTGDNINWSSDSFDDSDWKTIMVPAHWEVQGYKEYDGFAWYRKSFTIPSRLADESLILLLGKIDDVDQTFLNGQFVGSTGRWLDNQRPVEFDRNNEYQELRAYFLPAGLINKDGENVISVRVFDGFRDGGIYEGPIGVITQRNYRDYWQKKENN